MSDQYMDRLPPKRTGAWVALIFASIIALVDVYFWLPFFRACQANNHNVLAAIQTNMKTFALFAGVAAVFFVFSTIANVKFSRAKRFWGGSFGGFLGRFIIILEYAAYAAAIAFCFLK